MDAVANRPIVRNPLWYFVDAQKLVDIWQIGGEVCSCSIFTFRYDSVARRGAVKIFCRRRELLRDFYKTANEFKSGSWTQEVHPKVLLSLDGHGCAIILTEAKNGKNTFERDAWERSWRIKSASNRKMRLLWCVYISNLDRQYANHCILSKVSMK